MHEAVHRLQAPTGPRLIDKAVHEGVAALRGQADSRDPSVHGAFLRLEGRLTDVAEPAPRTGDGFP